MMAPSSSGESPTHVQVANGLPLPARALAPVEKAIRVGRSAHAHRRTDPAATAVLVLANVQLPLGVDPRAKAHEGRVWEDVHSGMLHAVPDRRVLPNGRQVHAMVIDPSAKQAVVHAQNDLTPKAPEAATGLAVPGHGKVLVAVIALSGKAAADRVQSGRTPKAPEAATGHVVHGLQDGMNGAASARNVPRSTDLPRISEDDPRGSRYDPSATWAPVARRPRMD